MSKIVHEKEIDDSETRKKLCKMLGIPYPVELNPNAVEESAGCLDKYFPDGIKVDVVKLIREIRGRK